jgi:hypothetical protein
VVDLEAEDFGEVVLVVVLEVVVLEDLPADLELLIVEVGDLLEEPEQIELCQDLQGDLTHIDTTAPIVCFIDHIGGIIDLGIGDGGIHLGGQGNIIDLGIIVPPMLVEEYYSSLF